MYRRYQATPSGPISNNKPKGPPPVKPHKECRPKEAETKDEKIKEKESESLSKTGSFLTKLIPQSLYNPQTGKVFGVLNTDDLFLVALIILLIDSGDEDEDNSMLIYALIYILISEHLDLPF